METIANERICIYDDHAEILIKNRHGEEVGRAMVDLDDVNKVRPYTWHLNQRGYPVASIYGEKLLLSRFVSGLVISGIGGTVDHINHNVLDNRKANLRFCTQGENCKNRKAKNTNSPYRIGVRRKPSGKWIATIGVDGKQIWLGTFDSMDAALRARMDAEKKYYGAFANHD